MPEFVMVPIPTDRVMEVYAFLAGEAAGAGAEAPLALPTITPAPGPATDPAVISRAYRESPDRMKAFLNYLGDRPGQAVSSREIGEAIGYNWNQVAGMLGAFGRRWEHRYKAAGSWFFEAKWNFGEKHMDYRMPEDAAAVMKREDGA